MAKYKNIGGTTVGFRSGSEEYAYGSSGNGAEGSIYYNSSNGQFEFVGTATGAWSTGGTMNTGRTSSAGTGSGSTDHIIAGGYYLPPSADRSATETYNGTSWSEVADCPNDLTYGNALGTGTASLLAGYSRPGPAPGGYGPQLLCHQWNGSSWSDVNNINTYRQFGGTAGSTTAGLLFGGSGPSALKTNESWDGTSWTETTDMKTAKTNIGGGCGTQTAALSASGQPTTTEIWDGSSWTEVAELNTARFNSSKIGLSTSALCAGGQTEPTFVANTEEWNGSSWTEVGDILAIQGYAGGTSPTGSAGSTDGLFAGGGQADSNSATYEWSLVHAIKTVTTS